MLWAMCLAQCLAHQVAVYSSHLENLEATKSFEDLQQDWAMLQEMHLAKYLAYWAAAWSHLEKLDGGHTVS